MVIVELTGGLGNQLFQYSAAKSLALYHKTDLILDITSFYREELPELEVPRNFELNQFSGVKEKVLTKKGYESLPEYKFLKQLAFKTLLPKHRRSIYKEPFYHFDSNFYSSKKDVLLKGGWQSEKYFQLYKNQLKKGLKIKEEVISRVKEFGEELKKHSSVSVHVRRGDYLRKQIILEWHGVLNAEHYKKGFATLQEKIPHFHIYYFSDDPLWVKQELIPFWPGTIVEEKMNSNSIEEFYLMSCCRHNIIANSSFSWWAAYLNANPDKIVIAPERWFDKAPNNTRDLFPEEWIRI